MKLYKHLFCICTILLLTQFSFSQNFDNKKTLDSLHTAVKQAKNKQSKVSTLLKICKFYKQTETIDLDSLDYYARKVLKLTKSKNAFLKQRINSLDYLAFKHIKLKKIDTAKVFINEIKQISEQLDYGLGLCLLNEHYASISKTENDLNMQIYYLENAYNIAKTYKLPSQTIFKMNINLSKAYFNFSYSIETISKTLLEVAHLADSPKISYTLKGSFYSIWAIMYEVSATKVNIDKAILNYHKAIDIFYLGNDKSKLLAPLSNLANLYEHKKQYKKAIKLYKEVIELKLKDSNSNVYYGLGLAYFDLKEFDKSAYYIKKALTEYKLINDNFGEGDCFMRLGEVYLKQLSPNKAYDSFEISISKYKQFIKENKKIGFNKYEISTAYYNLSSLYKYKKDYKLSLKYYKKHTRQRFKINQEQNLKATERFDLFKEKVKKNKEIESLELQNKKQELQTAKDYYIKIGLLFFLVLIISLLAVVYNRYRLKQKALRIIGEKNEENKLLMREIHHRVKNNLQIILSLLGTQINKNTNEELKNVLIESQNKVKSMAIIHQNLYNNNQFSKVEVSSYIKDLVVNIQKSFDKGKNNIQFNFDILKKDIQIALAVPLGLIINELVTNAYKYAFINKEENLTKIIKIDFKPISNSSKYLLYISDNGKGLPPNFNLDHLSSSGLQLVHGLVEQLNGSVKIEQEQGTSFTINVEEPCAE